MPVCFRRCTSCDGLQSIRREQRDGVGVALHHHASGAAADEVRDKSYKLELITHPLFGGHQHRRAIEGLSMPGAGGRRRHGQRSPLERGPPDAKRTVQQHAVRTLHLCRGVFRPHPFGAIEKLQCAGEISEIVSDLCGGQQQCGIGGGLGQRPLNQWPRGNRIAQCAMRAGECAERGRAVRQQ